MSGGAEKGSVAAFRAARQQKPDYLRIGAAPRKSSREWRFITDLVLGKLEIRDRHSRAIFCHVRDPFVALLATAPARWHSR